MEERNNRKAHSNITKFYDCISFLFLQYLKMIVFLFFLLFPISLTFLPIEAFSKFSWVPMRLI